MKELEKLKASRKAAYAASKAAATARKYAATARKYADTASKASVKADADFDAAWKFYTTNREAAKKD